MNNGASNVDALSALVEAMTVANPYNADGHVWAVATQPEFCGKLGWSISRFYRTISQPPFVRAVKEIDGANKTLLRIGEPGPETPEIIAKYMSKMLRGYRNRSRKALTAEREGLSGSPDPAAMARYDEIDHLLKSLPRLTTKDEYGHMIGLAEVWPAGYQAAIFKAVVADWPAYMAGMKMQIWQTGKGQEKFFEFVSTSVMRAFPQPAVELYVMEQQAAAEKLTPELIRLSRYVQG